MFLDLVLVVDLVLWVFDVCLLIWCFIGGGV